MSKSNDKDRLLTIRKMRDYAQEEFDKLIVYLSSGGLILTVGFVKDLVDLNDSIWKSILIATWGLFVLSLILILLSHRSAIKSSTLEIEALRAKKKFVRKQKERLSDDQDIITDKLNNSSFYILIIAIIMFIIFITINLQS